MQVIQYYIVLAVQLSPLQSSGAATDNLATWWLAGATTAVAASDHSAGTVLFEFQVHVEGMLAAQL